LRLREVDTCTCVYVERFENLRWTAPSTEDAKPLKTFLTKPDAPRSVVSVRKPLSAILISVLKHPLRGRCSWLVK